MRSIFLIAAVLTGFFCSAQHRSKADSVWADTARAGALLRAYEGGDRSPTLLEALIRKLDSSRMPVDTLLEEYADHLPPDSLKSVRVFQFIASMAPVLGSKADEVFRHDQLLFDHGWYVMPKQQRININDAIIEKSQRKAIHDKNEAYAIQIATFAQSTYVGQPAAGLRTYENIMMDFYFRTKDTSSYFPLALSYYDQYYMNVDVDSVKRADSVRLTRLLSDAKNSGDPSAPEKAKRKFAPSALYQAHELARAASSIYTVTENPVLLAAARRWMDKAMQLLPENYGVLDNYAHLLYAQKQKALAIETEQRAIDQKKKTRLSTSAMERDLEQMKAGTLVLISSK